MKKEEKKKKALTASEKNVIAGARLNYVMKIRGKEQIDLIKYINENYDDLFVAAGMMSQYLKGTKHIPNDIVIAFSEYLDIDPGYIMGLDGYLPINNDYYAYLSVMNTASELKGIQSQSNNYDKYLSHEGYAVKTIYRTKGKTTSMKISDQDQHEYLLDIRELNSYVKDIAKYYKTRTKQLIRTALKEGDAHD